MEVRISKQNLMEGVQKVQGIVELKGAMPILSCLLMRAEDDGIYIQATDLEIGIKGYYAANVIAQGQVVLNARKLHDIIRELPDEEIHLLKEDNHWVTLKCGKSLFRLPGMVAEDFPPFPDFSEDSLIDFKGSVLKEMIRKTAFAVSPDDTRKGISGLLLECEKGKITMVGTDGHRLAYINRASDTKNSDQKMDFILPKKILSELMKFMDDDETEYAFSVKENHFAFIHGKQVIVSRAIEGKFPDYKQVLPSENKLVVKVQKEILLHALKRVAILADEQSKMVKFEVRKAILTLVSDSTELGAAREEVPIDYQGDEMEIGLNARYLLDILGIIDQQQIILNLKDKDHSCLITVEEDQDFKSLVMPMRI